MSSFTTNIQTATALAFLSNQVGSVFLLSGIPDDLVKDFVHSGRTTSGPKLRLQMKMPTPIAISAAKKMLFAPEARDADFELGAKFWCYFCAQEIEKHKVVEMTTILVAGLLEHIASTEHKENAAQFFWDNLVTDKKLKASFLLTDGDLEIFRKASFLAVKRFQKTNQMERTKVAATIRYSEYRRQNFIQSEAEKSKIVAPRIGTLPGSGRHIEERIAGKRTVSAYADGLTFVEIQEDESEGNIYTGATPPWLQTDSSTDRKVCIGPTMEDFEKHLERERKSKLPANRVGARFDHTAESSQNWLPSFGRVWSKGRRLQSKLHFEKEWKFLSRVKSSDTDQRQKQAPNDWNNASSNPLQQNSANGYNGEQTQPHGVQETSVSDISSYTKRPDCFSSQDGCDSSSNLLSWAYSNIIPYKRKRTVESDAGNESHWSNSETVSTNQNSHSFLASQVLPYKSKRTESSVSNSLIQTPLLSGEKFS